MSKTNKTKYALLGGLSLKSGSGYDLKKFCDFSIAHFWNENYAHIYPVLKDMEKEGLVNKVTEQNEGRPPKNIYSITDKGRDELHEWLLLPVESCPQRNELLLKLFFSSNIPIENLIEKIMDYRIKHEALIEKYQRIEEIIKNDESTKDEKDLPLWLASISFGKYHSKAILNWCDETVKSIKK
jgi:DNA-binding PadR family transcriptional regulator